MVWKHHFSCGYSSYFLNEESNLQVEVFSKEFEDLWGQSQWTADHLWSLALFIIRGRACTLRWKLHAWIEIPGFKLDTSIHHLSLHCYWPQHHSIWWIKVSGIWVPNVPCMTAILHTNWRSWDPAWAMGSPSMINFLQADYLLWVDVLHAKWKANWACEQYSPPEF